jgi:hypothetical protein
MRCYDANKDAKKRARTKVSARHLRAMVWGVIATAGLCLIGGSELKAARRGPPNPGSREIVMALGSTCPCTAVSLSVLGDFLVRRGMRINVDLLGFEGRRYVDNEALTALVSRARGVPGSDIQGTDVMVDQSSEERKKLHARVSGKFWYYDGAGKLLFRGGITREDGGEHGGEHGRMGRNSGSASLMVLLEEGVEQASAFGCDGGEDHRFGAGGDGK